MGVKKKEIRLRRLLGHVRERLELAFDEDEALVVEVAEEGDDLIGMVAEARGPFAQHLGEDHGLELLEDIGCAAEDAQFATFDVALDEAWRDACASDKAVERLDRAGDGLGGAELGRLAL